MSKISPLGHYVLVEIPPKQEYSEGGIALPDDYADKQHAVTETGYVREIGPTCYVGWPGCDSEEYEPHEMWGIDIGDKVEFRKYEGKSSVVEGYEDFRYIPDTNIIGVIDDE